MKLNKKTLMLLLTVLLIILVAVLAIRTRPDFFNITNETFGVMGNKIISIISSVLLILISGLTVLLYRNTQEK